MNHGLCRIRGELGGSVNHRNVSRETFFQSAAICEDLRPIQFEFGVQLCRKQMPTATGGTHFGQRTPSKRKKINPIQNFCSILNCKTFMPPFRGFSTFFYFSSVSLSLCGYSF